MFRLSNLLGDARWPGLGIIILVSLFVMDLAASNAGETHQNVPVELVLIDTDGDGLRLCPVEPPVRLGFGSRHTEVRAWTCVGDDDALLLLVNQGRPPSLADVLGLKVGPENGFDHLSLAGGGDVRRTEIDSSESWFKYLVLWTDSDADRTVRDTELAGLTYLGFDRLVLTSSRPVATTLNGAIVTRQGAAIRRGSSHEMVSLRFSAQ